MRVKRGRMPETCDGKVPKRFAREEGRYRQSKVRTFAQLSVHVRERVGPMFEQAKEVPCGQRLYRREWMEGARTSVSCETSARVSRPCTR